MDEGMTADDRFIHRSSITGEIVSEDYAIANPDTTEKEKVTDRDSWMKEWIRLGELIQGYAPQRPSMVDMHTVNAVIHVQQLKRP